MTRLAVIIASTRNGRWPLLDQLVWWARALRDARTARPYTV
ncbi:hypothetical protein [Actinoallomurus acanthiterrae]